MNCCQMLRITQTIKAYWVYAFFMFAVSFFVYRFFLQQQSGTNYELFKMNAGWGYRIVQNDTVFIKQEQIPAVEGYKYFQTSRDAEATAKLVIQKMKAHSLPMISVHELDSMGVQY